MRVVNNREEERVPFSSIAVGEPFKYKDFLCLRIQSIIIDNTETPNSVDVETGNVFYTFPDASVVEIKASFVLEKVGQ